MLSEKIIALQADAYLRKLEPVVHQLQKDIPEARYDKRGLAQLVAQLLQFMEIALGINVSTADLFKEIQHLRPIKSLLVQIPHSACIRTHLSCT